MTASRKGDVALKYESRNFRTYTFEKKRARPSSITEDEGMATYNGTETYGRRGEVQKNIRARENLNEKVMQAK